MDSGLAAARRPGMTAVRSSGPGGYAIAASEVSIAVRYPEMPGQHRASKDERPRCAGIDPGRRPSRLARSQACAGCVDLPAVLAPQGDGEGDGAGFSDSG